MNKEFQDKLRQYTLLVSPMLAAGLSAEAQIIYHDIDPDIIYKDSISGDNYATPHFLDLDNDGRYDIEFAVFSSAQSNNGPNKVNIAAARQVGAKGNALMGYTNLFSASFCSTPLPVYCLSALNANRGIGQGANFWAVPDTNNLGTLIRSFKNISPPNNFLGQWNDLTDKYIGLRFLGGDGNIHYGWIRLDVTRSPASITLKDYAYEMQDGGSIDAGDKGVTGISTPNSNYTCTISNSKDFVNILVNNERLEGAMVVITNALGQTILTQSINSNLTKLDLHSLGSGIYVVTVHLNDKSFSKIISL